MMRVKCAFPGSHTCFYGSAQNLSTHHQTFPVQYYKLEVSHSTYSTTNTQHNIHKNHIESCSLTDYKLQTFC